MSRIHSFKWRDLVLAAVCVLSVGASAFSQDEGGNDAADSDFDMELNDESDFAAFREMILQQAEEFYDPSEFPEDHPELVKERTSGIKKLSGTAGDDVFVFGPGDGQHTITDYDQRQEKRNVVRLREGVTPDSVRLRAFHNPSTGLSLAVELDTGDMIILDRSISSSTAGTANAYSIEAIEFADGTVWEWADILARPLYIIDYPEGQKPVIRTAKEGMFIVGTDAADDINSSHGGDIMHGMGGDDTLTGGNGDDTLWGGPGDDQLRGGSGNDIYIFGPGDGQDVVSNYDQRKDKRSVIRLREGVTPDSVRLRAYQHPSTGLALGVELNADDMIVWDRGISSSTAGRENAYSIEAIEFADGTVWEWADILAMPLYIVDYPEGQKPVIRTAKEGMFIVGTDAADDINSSHGGDIMHGMGGDDTLTGGNGNDTLWGGPGDDQLRGGSGDDVYIFGPGDGQDVVSNYDQRKEKRSVIRLHEDVTPGSVRLRAYQHPSTGLALGVELDTGDMIIWDRGISNSTAGTANAYSIEAIEFADDTVWEWADILTMPLYIMDYPDGQKPNIRTAQEGMFIVGTDAADEIISSHGGDIMHGGGGDDTLTGGNGNDTLWGGPGDDQLKGGSGNDVYLFGPGDGRDFVSNYDQRKDKRSVIRLRDGVTPDSVRLRAYQHPSTGLALGVELDTGDMIIWDRGISNSTAGTANAYSIEAIEFADGTVWEWADILAMPLSILDYPDGQKPVIRTAKEGMFIIGTEAADDLNSSHGGDILYGKGGDDVLTGGNGDDVLWGGPGNDKLEGGGGNDVYVFSPGDGQDTLNDNGGDDVVLFRGGLTPADVTFSKNQNDLIVTIPATGDKHTIRNQFPNTGNRIIESFRFETGNIRLNDMELFIAQTATLGPPAGVRGAWSQAQRERLLAMGRTLWTSQPWEMPLGMRRILKSEKPVSAPAPVSAPSPMPPPAPAPAPTSMPTARIPSPLPESPPPAPARTAARPMDELTALKSMNADNERLKTLLEESMAEALPYRNGTPEEQAEAMFRLARKVRGEVSAMLEKYEGCDYESLATGRRIMQGAVDIMNELETVTRRNLDEHLEQQRQSRETDEAIAGVIAMFDNAPEPTQAPAPVQAEPSDPIERLRHRAGQGDTDAMYGLAKAYETGDGVAKNAVESASWNRRAAELGHAKAQNNYGYNLEYGIGVAKNIPEAIAWYQKAAMQGNAIAQTNLGIFYLHGEYVPRNYAEAFRLFQTAASSNHADAQTCLGYLYDNGLGVPLNHAEAARWYRLAAEQGNVDALANLGVSYDNGLGVPVNKAEAARLYRLAAEKGHVLSQYHLATYYFNGVGVPKDIGQAEWWYRQAANQGHQPSIDSLNAIHRDYGSRY